MTAPLPYGPTMTALLDPLRGAFRLFNHTVAAPLIRVGAGPLLSTRAAGSLLVLRTIGRTSGQVREAPLAYAVVDGRVVVIAGYGRRAHWFRNALAHPEVEVLLPGAVLAGRADEVTDPVERRAMLRTLISSMGIVGTLTLGDVHGKTDAEIDLLAEAFPILAITPAAVRTGPYDPGGVGPRLMTTLWALVLGGTVWAVVRRAGFAAGASRKKRAGGT